MYLHRMVYYSENKIRDLGLSLPKEMRAIIQSGQKNNPPAGLTGALLFNEQYFAGVLEGDRRRVSAALMRISRDKRTTNVTILSVTSVHERMFDGWDVAYAGHSEDIDRIYMRHGIVVGLDPARMSAESMLALIRSISAVNAFGGHGQADGGMAGFAAPPVAPEEPREVFKVSNAFGSAAGGNAPAAAPAGRPLEGAR